MDSRLDGIIAWIRTTAGAAGGLLVPVSGGSDSALCFWLCAQALPGRVNATYVGETLRARSWFESLGPLDVLPHPAGPGDAEALRWAVLISQGLHQGHWLAGSRSRTEDVFGTYSLASRVATYLPLVGLWKSEVMVLCDHVGVPAEISRSSRRADPACGRPLEMAEIPFSLVDRFLQVKEGERPVEDLTALGEARLRYLEGIFHYTRFKKGLPLRGPRP
jgi:NH3-dependent NAD+ synthetase